MKHKDDEREFNWQNILLLYEYYIIVHTVQNKHGWQIGKI